MASLQMYRPGNKAITNQMKFQTESAQYVRVYFKKKSFLYVQTQVNNIEHENAKDVITRLKNKLTYLLFVFDARHEAGMINELVGRK